MSSSSESDEDYVPGEPEQVSEEGSADEETDLQYEKELEHKAKKRKSVQKSAVKKRRRTQNKVEKDEENDKLEDTVDPVEEKKREEDLWAMFLEGTDSKTKPKESNTTSTTVTTAARVNKTTQENPKKDSTQNGDDEKSRERRIFEFAGETIVVENNVIKEKIKASEDTATASKTGGPSFRGRGSGGLSNVLGQLNKKNKLSTLEKSKFDWETYKKEEGIEDEIQSHNKGRDGYLDRQDFLERADLRQYEIERDLRMNRRSNR